MIKFKITETANKLMQRGISVIPRRATEGSVGYDIFACIEGPEVLFPGDIRKIPSGVHIWIGESKQELFYTSGFEIWDKYPIAIQGQCVPRSSIHPGLMLVNTVGTLDFDYQGEWICKYINQSNDIITINPGDRLTQMVFIPVLLPELQRVDYFHEETDRNDGGFGSTGK